MLIRRFFPFRWLHALLFCVSALPAVVSAALKWETQRIEITTKPSDKEAVGLFRFTNTGDKPVTISSVQSSCGCTTAVLAKNVYGPGESGEIKAVFTIGDRVGEQEKSIFVITDDARDRSLALALHVTIPELLHYAPRLLMWNVGEKPEEKATAITSNSKLKIASIEITASAASAELAARISPVEAGTSYQLLVRPLSTGTVMNAPVAGIATFSDGTTQPFKIYALVR